MHTCDGEQIVLRRYMPHEAKVPPPLPPPSRTLMLGALRTTTKLVPAIGSLRRGRARLYSTSVLCCTSFSGASHVAQYAWMDPCLLVTTWKPPPSRYMLQLGSPARP